MKEEKQYGFLWFFLILALIVYLFFQAFKAPFPLTTLFLFIMGFIGFMGVQLYGALDPKTGFYKGPTFKVKSGPEGTLIEGPIPASGNRVTYIASFPKRFIPKNKRKKWYNKGLGEFVTLTEELAITDIPEMFVQVQMKDLEALEGAIHYKGRLDGRTIEDDESIMLEEIRSLRYQLLQVVDISRNAQAQLRNLSKQRTEELREATETARRVSDLMKNIEVIVGGRGGSGGAGAIGAVADNQ